MSNRCVACNKVLERGTLLSTNPLTGLPEDMCNICRFKSSSEYSVITDHSYHHEAASEGFSESSKRGYYYDWHD